MTERMRSYAISAVTPDDDIFKPARVRVTSKDDLKRVSGDAKDARNQITKPELAAQNTANAVAYESVKPPVTNEEPPAPQTDGGLGFSFDKKTLTVYKRIPEGVECSYESLAGDGITVSDVSTAILRLQIGGFVTVYPGDFVARKFKG